MFAKFHLVICAIIATALLYLGLWIHTVLSTLGPFQGIK